MYPLFIATRVLSDITFKSLISGIRPAQPRNGNAFYLGLPTFRYPKPSSFDLSVQFCRIPEEDYHRAGDLRFDEQIHPDYFREAIWL